VSLDHLHGILRERFILVLEVTFYADESGIHDPHGEQLGSEVATVAGYIATKDQWKKFERRWNTALKKFKVSEFHMSEFNREKQKPDSPYVGWPNEKKKRFLRLLIKIARDNTLYGYASMVETKAWDTILDNETKLGLPKRKKGKLLEVPVYNPYITCFQNFFAKFPKFLNEAVDPIVSKRALVERVAFVFHQHQVFGPAAQIGYNIVHKDLDYDHRFGTITFGSSEEYPPLQAADLFAFYCRKSFTHYLKNIPQDEFELALLHPDKCYLIHLSPENLKDLREKNERLRQEREKAGARRENS
jgi:Protein of unknown function (DUF3800)